MERSLQEKLKNYCVGVKYFVIWEVDLNLFEERGRKYNNGYLDQGLNYGIYEE